MVTLNISQKLAVMKNFLKPKFKADLGFALTFSRNTQIGCCLSML